MWLLVHPQCPASMSLLISTVFPLLFLLDSIKAICQESVLKFKEIWVINIFWKSNKNNIRFLNVMLVIYIVSFN